MPKFSFLVANYNNGIFFLDCYKSIMAQSIQNWEVIILDDCSIDDSIEIIEKITSNDSRFKIFKNEKNKGVGFTKKRLVELATSEICGFLDPDDAVESDALEIILKAHIENPNVGLIYTNLTFCDEFLNKKSEHIAKQINDLDENYHNFNGEISHFATFKRNIYNKTAGIDSSLKIAEDKDWYMKMCEVAPVLHIDKSLYLYRIHKGGISNNNLEKALFWHWVAMMKMAERNNLNIEKLFINQYIQRDILEKEIQMNNNHSKFRKRIKRSKWLKLGKLLGFFKYYDEL